MAEPHVIFITGVPGTGKSTAAAALKNKYEREGQRILFINDYPLLNAWANEMRGQEDYVRWQSTENGGEFFNIVPERYREVSAIVAKRIAEKIQAHIENDEYDVFVVEAARGAGPEGARDRYGEELFAPICKALGEQVSFTAIETRVSDMNELTRRMEARSEVDPTAAPPFVAGKYISTLEGAQSSRPAAEALGMPHVLIDNTNPAGNPEEAISIFEILVSQAMIVLAEDRMLDIREEVEGTILTRRRGTPES